ncbi:unnamed protein product [Trichogramma brassicae]|uniref:Uncharacterized protein n=1 Tax=Trichogramma brassicae TaxID=86971 RepID=A0A6H5IQ43_9HYME|nr:unnamed protein product [Trichogramma brassicae]
MASNNRNTWVKRRSYTSLDRICVHSKQIKCSQKAIKSKPPKGSIDRVASRHSLLCLFVLQQSTSAVTSKLCSATISPAVAIIGYDCNSNSLNVTTVSRLGVEECRIPRNTLNVTRQYIQLLQLTDYQEVEVLQCKIELHRTVQHCGMHSHTSAVQRGIAEYISEISKNACEDAHLTGVYNYGGHSVIRGLKVNSTTSHPITLAGTLTPEGACSGTSYADPYGSWNDVVVQATIKITLTSQTARVDLDNNKLYLRSGTTCNFRDNYCIDSEGGYSYWHTLPKDYCKFSRYSILYEGYAEKAVDPRAFHPETLYSVTTEDITFALTIKKKELICGYHVQKTEHPKLLIFETRKGESFAEHHTPSTSNLDIFAYINSKFIYVEKHMKSQIQNLYHDVLYQRCTQERETIKNSLAIAHSSPDQFAYNLMKGPGFMSLIAGEIVHIMRCIPVEVRFVHSDECYAELKGEPQQREPINLQAVNPLNFFKNLIRWTPTVVKRTKLKSSKGRKKTKVAQGSDKEKLSLTPVTLGDDSISPTKDTPSISSAITPTESQEVLNSYILTAEKEAQDTPLIIDDDDSFIYLYDEDPIGSPYVPEPATEGETLEVPYIPTAIPSSSKADEEKEIPIPEPKDQGFVPIPFTREYSLPREWDDCNAPASRAETVAPKTTGQKTKLQKQRRRTRGCNTAQPEPQNPGPPTNESRAQHQVPDPIYLKDYRKKREAARKAQHIVDKRRGAKDLYKYWRRPNRRSSYRRTVRRPKSKGNPLKNKRSRQS